MSNLKDKLVPIVEGHVAQVKGILSKVHLGATEYEAVMLALMVWREARSESFQGKLAVAWTVRNRVEHTKWWGTDIVGVITKKWQYSSMTATGDPQLSMFPKIGDSSFKECMVVACGVINNEFDHPAPGADSYYADYIKRPKWATDQNFVKKIGVHCFHNVDQDFEKPITDA